MARADAYRWSGRWVELTADIRSAIDAARTVGDAELVLRAATSGAQGALWQTTYHGEVDETLVAALREGWRLCRPNRRRCAAVRQSPLPASCTTPSRSRSGAPSSTRRWPYRQTRRPALRVEVMGDLRGCGVDVCHRARTRPPRRGVGAYRRRDRSRSGPSCPDAGGGRPRRAGRPDRMRELAEAMSERSDCDWSTPSSSERPDRTLGWRWAGARRKCEQMLEPGAAPAPAGLDPAIRAGDDGGGVRVRAVWNGSAPDVVEPLMAMARNDPLPMAPIVGALLCRVDRVDVPAEDRADPPRRPRSRRLVLDAGWCNAAELSMYLQDPVLAADVLALIAPFARSQLLRGAPATPPVRWTPTLPSRTSRWATRRRPRSMPIGRWRCASNGRSRWPRNGCATSDQFGFNASSPVSPPTPGRVVPSSEAASPVDVGVNRGRRHREHR